MPSLVLENPEVRKLVSTISVEEYHRLNESGVLSQKTELIEGVILDKMTKSPDHGYFSDLFFEKLSKIKPSDSIIRCEKPLTLKRSEPEPDITIIKGSLQDFRKSNPQTALLVVEIAKTSIGYDREKIAIYAEAQVENYWIVDLNKKQVESYSKPTSGDYTIKILYNSNDHIPIFDSEIDLKEIFF